MSHVAIIGGGFAGLAAAVHLAGRGVRVTLLERRKHLGGRAYSFRDSTTGDTVDNGQHLFMRCYRATCDFLERIGTADRLRFQDRLRIEFRHPRIGRTCLNRPPLVPAPYHLLAGLLRLKTLRPADVAAVRHLAGALEGTPDESLSVEDWLVRCKQSPRIRRALWHPLCVSALNALPESGSAAHFAAVLREGFFSSARDCDLGYATVGLSALYTDAAQGYVESRDGSVCLGTAAAGVEVAPAGGHVVRVRNGSPIAADAVICAVPPPALNGLLPDELSKLKLKLSAFCPSPILSVNLWFDRPVVKADFVGLLERRTNWVFNKAAMYRDRDRASAGSVVLVTSAAHRSVDLPDEQLVAESLADLRTLFPAAVNAHLMHHLVIRERQATFALPRGPRQPGPRTAVRGFYLAGDWTDTGLPCTIESAVRSGYRGAECALEDQH